MTTTDSSQLMRLLGEAQTAVTDAEDQLHSAQAERDTLIRAMSLAGISYAAIARATGLTPERVRQIAGTR
jgi:hypothetical protein